MAVLCKDDGGDMESVSEYKYKYSMVFELTISNNFHYFESKIQYSM